MPSRAPTASLVGRPATTEQRHPHPRWATSVTLPTRAMTWRPRHRAADCVFLRLGALGDAKFRASGLTPGNFPNRRTDSSLGVQVSASAAHTCPLPQPQSNSAVTADRIAKRNLIIGLEGHCAISCDHYNNPFPMLPTWNHLAAWYGPENAHEMQHSSELMAVPLLLHVPPFADLSKLPPLSRGPRSAATAAEVVVLGRVGRDVHLLVLG